MRVRGQALAVLMRSPGRERDLIAGFLAAEGVLDRPEDLQAVEPCRDPAGRAEANVWNVALAPGIAVEPDRRWSGMIGSSCGLCGTRTLEALERQLPPVAPWAELPAELLRAGFAALRERQALYGLTAGVHGVGLLAEDGQLIDVAEDVGRHNAVDKLLGARLRAGEYPLERRAVLLVSGRLSFELVQKAALAGVGGLAGIGAPTSLAVDGARRFGLRLSAWVRDDGVSAFV